MTSFSPNYFQRPPNTINMNLRFKFSTWTLGNHSRGDTQLLAKCSGSLEEAAPS
jgi:hypothetical protein